MPIDDLGKKRLILRKKQKEEFRKWYKGDYTLTLKTSSKTLTSDLKIEKLE